VTQASVADWQEFTPHSTVGERTPPGEPGAETLRRFAEAFLEGAGPALVTALNRPVTARVLGAELVSPAEMLGRIPTPWVVVTCAYSRGLSGTHWLVLSMPHAVTLARAFPAQGQEGGAEVSAGQREALREAGDQMMAAARAPLAALLKRPFFFAPARVFVAYEGEVLPPGLDPLPERFWLIRAEVSGPDGFRVELCLTSDVELSREVGAMLAEISGAQPRREAPGGEGASRLDLILDITLPVTVELGRTRMQIQDVLRLSPGSVIELDKAAGEPVELYINDRPIAKGEVVVIDENFGVRLTSIVTPTERIRTLR
jgi:flagellar motor switch protein FliN/FliY